MKPVYLFWAAAGPFLLTASSLLLTPGSASAQTPFPANRNHLTPGPLFPNKSPLTLPATHYQDFLLPGELSPKTAPKISFCKTGPNPIKSSQPDNMPCWTPNTANTERMPFKRLPNGRPIDHIPVQ